MAQSRVRQVWNQICRWVTGEVGGSDCNGHFAFLPGGVGWSIMIGQPMKTRPGSSLGLGSSCGGSWVCGSLGKAPKLSFGCVSFLFPHLAGKSVSGSYFFVKRYTVL